MNYFLLQEEKTETEKISETHENGSVNGLAVSITADGLEVDGECRLDLLLSEHDRQKQVICSCACLDQFLGLV